MKFESDELDMMLAALRSHSRRQENATKAVRAEHVEATRTAIVKVQKLRMKAVKE